MDKQQQSFNDRLTEQLLSSENGLASKPVQGYSGSQLQKETYLSLEKDDLLYRQFITRQYGSFDNFMSQTRINQDINVFDPTIDYIIDTTVINENVAYKTDHLSSQELIMENLSGVCTVWFNKINGNTRRLNCTLDRKYMPSKELNVRAAFFTPMGNDRVGVWDLNTQSWKSFYMSKVFKFVRDDTVGIE